MWRDAETPNPNRRGDLLSAVAAVNPRDVWAVGGAGGTYSDQLYRVLVEHWDGSSWRSVRAPDPGKTLNELEGVDAVSVRGVWAVGYQATGPLVQPLVEHWDGTTWTVVPTPDLSESGYLRDISVLDRDDIWAVGARGDVDHGKGSVLLEHWDGRAWSVVASPSGGKKGYELSAVDASGPDDVWAVGTRQAQEIPRPFIIRWDGRSWRQVAFPVVEPLLDGGLSSIDVSSREDVWATGVTSFHWDGRTWKAVPLGLRQPVQLPGVSIAAADDVWAAGFQQIVEGRTNPVLAHWDGSRWKALIHRGGRSTYLVAIDALSSGGAWAVGWRETRFGHRRTLIQSSSCTRN